MRLLWHIFKKDLRRLRLPLALWSTLQLLSVAAVATLWLQPEKFGEHLSGGFTAALCIFLASLYAGFDFAIRLAQEDAPADANAFWRTRPISGARLLLTKLLTLVVTNLLASAPALALTRLVTDDSAASWWLTVQGWLLLSLIGTGIAVALGTLTKNLRQAFLLTLTLLVFAILLGVATNLVTPHLLSLPEKRTLTTVATLAFAATFAGTLVHQFLTLRSRRSFVLFGAALLLTASLPFYWRWDFSDKWVPPPDAPEVTGTQIELRSATAQPAMPLGRSYPPKLTLGLSLAPLPANLSLTVRDLRHAWGGYVVPHRTDNRQPHPANIQQTLLRAPASIRRVQEEASLTLEQFSALSDGRAHPAYTGQISYELYRAEIVAELPLTPLAHTSHDDHAIRLISVSPRDGRLELLTRERPRRQADTPRPTYALWNKRTGEIRASADTLIVNSPILSASYFKMDFPQIADASSTGFPEDWLRDAVLVKIAHRPAGFLTRTIHAADFQSLLRVSSHSNSGGPLAPRIEHTFTTPR